MAGLQSGEGRMMIDSVVWTHYINVTDRHTDSHFAVANAAPTQYGIKRNEIKGFYISHQPGNGTVLVHGSCKAGMRHPLRTMKSRETKLMQKANANTAQPTSCHSARVNYAVSERAQTCAPPLCVVITLASTPRSCNAKETRKQADIGSTQIYQASVPSVHTTM